MSLKTMSRTINNDHLSPKMSNAVLMGQVDRNSIFFFFTPQNYNATC